MSFSQKDAIVKEQQDTTRNMVREGGRTLVTVEMELPNEMKRFAMPENEEEQLVRNAMILYPYIRNKRISHGRAAEILGIHKWDLIELYGKMGFCYFDQTKGELERELQVFQQVKQDGVRT